MVSVLLVFITASLVLVKALFRAAFLVRVTVDVLLVFVFRGALVIVVHITEGTVAAGPLSMKVRGQDLKQTSGEASQWFGRIQKAFKTATFSFFLQSLFWTTY